jgi:hypothetical protein
MVKLGWTICRSTDYAKNLSLRAISEAIPAVLLLTSLRITRNDKLYKLNLPNSYSQKYAGQKVL